ncbi:hypothetical protein AJ80_04774 [Polytolypa hystricis UAMH7299]|uniref:Mitochondrial outer membrane protein n=1 Tax=Polytolypa hystricis (strain UAMH7299) TaxID=1447883 RepID=A0A2B7Y8M4_POLH7|nr:hypothetical protein AJ80_04774 [Polytolypa hystricis UAMH7299]
MPEDDNATTAAVQVPAAPGSVSRFPSVPAPVKRVFDRFPLATYPPNDVPRRLSNPQHEHRLYVFIDARGAKHGRPSYNPHCLKWQAYLKFIGINFTIIPSNNHASPTGALPFLLPAASSSGVSADHLVPVPSTKLQKWAIEQMHVEEEQQLSIRFDVYASLLDHRIRNAWLYTFYLDQRNFDAIARKFYVNSSTSNIIVRAILARQLQQAAKDELLKTSSYIDVDDIEMEACNAFDALSTLLGPDEHFFGRQTPGLFDASVFAYTHLLLDDSLGWQRNALGKHLSKLENLVQHRQRLLEMYF